MKNPMLPKAHRKKKVFAFPKKRDLRRTEPISPRERRQLLDVVFARLMDRISNILEQAKKRPQRRKPKAKKIGK